MKIPAIQAVVAAAVCAAAGAFWGGYKIGAEHAAADTAVTKQTEVIPSAMPAAQQTKYTVISENGKLCLYEVTDKGQTLLASEEVSIEIFPPEDRVMLSKGESFTDFYDARALFEDFAG